MAARGDPLAGNGPPAPDGAESRAYTLPELERRLLHQRTAVVESVERLRGRVRQDLRDLSPMVQAQRRPAATLAMAGVAGLLMGRVMGRLAARWFG